MSLQTPAWSKVHLSDVAIKCLLESPEEGPLELYFFKLGNEGKFQNVYMNGLTFEAK